MILYQKLCAGVNSRIEILGVKKLEFKNSLYDNIKMTFFTNFRCAVAFYDELGHNNYSRFERSECYAKYKACV